MSRLASRIAAAALATVLIAPEAFAQQEATLEQSPAEGRAARSAQRKLELERRTREALTGQPVLIYGGFLVDFKQAEKKRQLFNLRQPRDPRTDNKHLYMDERSERPKGFVFFSIGF
jgi:hypothetical protein